MLFPKIDTRAQLLAAGDTRGAKVINQLEICMATALSQRAVAMMNRAQTAMRTYRVEAARVLYSDAATAAREDRDGFAEAAAMMLLSQLLDGCYGRPEAQGLSCAEAAEVLGYDIFGRSEELLEKRMKRDIAVTIMQPRLALRDLLAHNREHYEVRTKSGALVDARKRADQLIGHRSADAAIHVAEAGRDNAARTFGRDHWWAAAFETRRVLAMIIRDRKVSDEARKIAVHAINLYSEWSHEGTDPAFAIDVDMMTQAADGTLVLA